MLLHNFLHTKKCLLINDCRMCVLNLNHSENTVVYHLTLRDVVFAVKLLQHKITAVFFVVQYPANGFRSPLTAVFRQDIQFVQLVRNRLSADSVEKICKNHTNGLCFIRYDLQNALRVSLVAQHDDCTHLSELKILADAPFLVFTCRVAFFLCVRC
ncbi:MAG: hypothetical protein BWY95_02693 [Bacteroidetes bacterium ADurb.BinA104]|nr:MAG: hypothetical protein BWY95_02693 [Bacteroidetes bacterium ADurb.BinA104]